MQKFLICFFALVACASSARMAFKLSAGFENLIEKALDKTFTCDDKTYGYYADVQNDCKIFHVCFPIQKADGEVRSMEQFSFVCGNGTVFNQESLTCTSVEDAVPCPDSINLFETVNAEFGKIFRARQDNVGQNDLGGQVQQEQIVPQEEVEGTGQDNVGQIDQGGLVPQEQIVPQEEVEGTTVQGF